MRNCFWVLYRVLKAHSVVYVLWVWLKHRNGYCGEAKGYGASVSGSCFLKSGYNPIVKEHTRYYDVQFKSIGFENFKEDHKQKIRDIAGNKLMEFYYGQELQSVYIQK